MISNIQSYPQRQFYSPNCSSNSSSVFETPSEADVVMARGRAYWDHRGNVHYRSLIAMATERYAASSSKLEKSMIVSEIIEKVHDSNGRFVKKITKTQGNKKRIQQWIEADEEQVREKVSQSIRDGLSGLYRSATKAKKQRRNKVNEKFNEDIEKMIYSNAIISRKMEELNHHLSSSKTYHKSTRRGTKRSRDSSNNDKEQQQQRYGTTKTDNAQYDEELICQLFDQTNFEILETIKNDSTLLGGYIHAQTAANIESEILCL